MASISKNWFLNLSPILHPTMHRKKSKRVTHFCKIISLIPINLTLVAEGEEIKIISLTPINLTLDDIQKDLSHEKKEVI